MHELSKTIKSYNKQVNWHSAKFDIYDLSKYLLKFIRLLKGKKILDFGCGNGRDLEFFHKNNFDVIGIDYSDKLIKEAKSRVNNVKIFKMNFLKKLKFNDKEFDGIWASASLLHVPKKSLNKVLLELKRLLKDNGILFILVKEGKGEKMIKDDYGNEVRFFLFFKQDELVKKLKLIGFKVIQSYLVSDESLRIKFKKKKKQKWIMLYSIKQ